MTLILSLDHILSFSGQFSPETVFLLIAKAKGLLVWKPHGSLVEMSTVLRKGGSQWNDWAKGLLFPSSLHGVCVNQSPENQSTASSSTGWPQVVSTAQWLKATQYNGWFLGKEPFGNPILHENHPSSPGDSTKYIKKMSSNGFWVPVPIVSLGVKPFSARHSWAPRLPCTSQIRDGPAAFQCTASGAEPKTLSNSRTSRCIWSIVQCDISRSTISIIRGT